MSFTTLNVMNVITLFLPGAGSLRGLDTGTVGEEGGVVGVDGVCVWKIKKKFYMNRLMAI